jgi:heat shock protein HslJ
MILSTLFTLLLACGDKANDTGTDTEDTATTEETYSVQGMEFVFISADGFDLVGDWFSLSFSDELNEMQFSAGCNSHYTEYTIVDGVFEASSMGSTEMGCETELMDQDAWLANFFTSQPTISHEGASLTFVGTEATLVFQDAEVAIPDQELQGMTWEIDTYLDGGAASNYNLDVLPNLYFAEDGTFTANMGCNGAGGTYTDDNGTLTMTIETMTEAICGEPLNSVEGHIFNVIYNTPTYEIDGNRITLMAGEKGISAMASPE